MEVREQLQSMLEREDFESIKEDLKKVANADLPYMYALLLLCLMRYFQG